MSKVDSPVREEQLRGRLGGGPLFNEGVQTSRTEARGTAVGSGAMQGSACKKRHTPE